jgi:hypothetical protein
MDNSPLLGRFLQAFPKQFLVRLIARQKPLYAQSIALAFNEGWSRAEAFSVLPSIRRALWENETRASAIECGLLCSDEPHAGENCSCVTVRSDGLILTVHYVEGPNQFVREAESRKQNAGVNKWLHYFTDERLLTSPVPKINSRPIYLNLLHGAAFPTSSNSNLDIDETSYFLRVAIPACDSTMYLYNWSAQELLQSYAAAPQAAQPAVALEDRAQPRKKAEAPIEKKNTRGKAE